MHISVEQQCLIIIQSEQDLVDFQYTPYSLLSNYAAVSVTASTASPALNNKTKINRNLECELACQLQIFCRFMIPRFLWQFGVVKSAYLSPKP